MSTLVAQTISNGTVSTSSANVIQGSAKAWVNFNGSSAAIRSSYNISSVTRNGTGDYTVTFTNAMSDTEYAIVNGGQTAGDTFMTANIFRANLPYTPTTTSVRLRVGNHAGQNDDPRICIAIFR
jgi:hypothetical protein